MSSRIRFRNASFGVLVAFVSSFLFGASAAEAVVVQIPAVAFVHGIESFCKEEADQGRLCSRDHSYLYAPLPFHGQGVVCKFTMIYIDRAYVDYIFISAALHKKSIRIGGSPGSGAIVMAQVSSAKEVRSEKIRALSTGTIKSPRIDSAKEFHFVSVEKDETAGDLGFIGLQVEIKESC